MLRRHFSSMRSRLLREEEGQGATSTTTSEDSYLYRTHFPLSREPDSRSSFAFDSGLPNMFDKLRKNWGLLLFSLFACLYLTDFYQISAKIVEDKNQHVIPQSVRLSTIPLNTGRIRDTVLSLPGAVNSEGKSFESQGSNTYTSKLSLGALPGAIGSSGSFDGDTPSLTLSQGNPTKTENKGTLSVSVKSNLAKNNMKAEGPSISPKKKRKLKRTSGKKLKTRKGAKSTKSKSSKSQKISETSEQNASIREKASSKDSSRGVLESGEESLEKSRLKESKKSEEKRDMNSDHPRQTSSGEGNSSIQDKETTGTMIDHPMNRRSKHLQVPSNTGSLDEGAIKKYYRQLVKAYLRPFTNGIKRKSLFDVLRRRSYSLTPPGGNKGMQTMLFQIIDGRVHLMDPYEIRKNSKPFYISRITELIWLLSAVAKDKTIPNTEFLVAIHDCVQTVNKDHTYRGATYKESNPTFTIVACNFSDNIPIPMWEGGAVRGGLKLWDKKMELYRSGDSTPWEDKKSQAVFRGGNRPSMYFSKKKDADEHCDDVGRTRLEFIGKENPDLFDVGVQGRCGGKYHAMSRLSESDHHSYKYILYAEGNCFWADRLNKQVFGPSMIIKQETPCGQFWEPLLGPMTHYLPTDFFFQDTVDQVSWARDHDDEAQAIVKNANEFASNFLSFTGIKAYVKVLLTEYSKLLETKDLKAEQGSQDVTVEEQ